MDLIRIIDTFPAYLDYWQIARNKPISEQIETWASKYMAPWPELLAKQIESYSEEGFEWDEIARKMVFPFLNERLVDMKTAHINLTTGLKRLIRQAGEKLGVDSPITIVIYVGVGLGAGWVTTYQNKPAILFGLENIAEEGWGQPGILAGLAAHEFGHLAHFHWRQQAGLPDGSGPWWLLYCEGFAQWCEHHITGHESWHMQHSSPGDWLAWCQQNKAWLAGEFLQRAPSTDTVRPFFGSWYDLQGYKHCGYYLGYEVLQALIGQSDFKQVAVLEDYQAPVKEMLHRFTGRSA